MIHVRLATPSDRARAIAIVFDTLRSYGIEPEPEGLDADVMVFGDQADGSYEIIATLDGEPVGVSALSPHGDPRNREGWVSKVFVDARFRSRGAAKLLMADVVREARARGYLRLALKTRTIFKEAVRLYESSGWTFTGTPSSGPCDRSYVLDLDAPAHAAGNESRPEPE